MKKFISYTAFVLISYIIFLEFSTRIFDLSAITMEEENIEGNRMYKPNSKGVWIRGGQRELVNNYKINSQGFNSIKDYSRLNGNKINIAIIGDSYVEGFHVGVENSIGRILENVTNNQVEVHEYGHSGGNIVDFSLIFEKWIKNKYDYTFILMTDKDITAKKPSFMGNGNKIPKESLARDFYNNFSFIRYLNINHGISVGVRKVFSLNNFSSKNKVESLNPRKINFDAFKIFDSTVTLLFEEEKLDSSFRSQINFRSLKIKHNIKPMNHGFDGHWNYNGRKNCALTIKEFLLENKVIAN